jgi:alpha-L-fucosidase 2
MIASRVRRGNHALQLLEAYKDAFIWPNGFHVNGDYKRTGRAYFDEEFMMSAETSLTAAVNEMLLQGWGGRLRIFPAVPEKWQDASFHNLRAEGGYLVSAEMRRREVISATVEAEKGGEVQVVWPGGQATLKLSPGERREILVQ